VDVARQILHLLIASIPTVVLFYLFMRAVFFKPMMHVLEERAQRTEGAKRQAARLDGSAQQKRSAYQRALDKVRAEILGKQEAARRTALEERAELLRQTRANAYQRVLAAKQQLDKELAGARGEVASESERLAEDVVKVVLAGPRQAQGTTGRI
jgi:F0F1-type ATP synthase membrane subunit b/b'